MLICDFEQATRIDDQARLRDLFGSNSISLDAHSSVVLEGRISLGSEVLFSGHCRLATGTAIENGCILTNAQIGNENLVRPYSILSNMRAGSGNLFGPFCFIRDECLVGDNCILGSHVESARSIFASGVKISHHAFVGDADVGENTIIGAGVVFCNFNGAGRQCTKIGSDVMVGSGALLVAPLSIGDGSIIAAGSTLTKNVPDNSKIIQKR